MVSRLKPDLDFKRKGRGLPIINCLRDDVYDMFDHRSGNQEGDFNSCLRGRVVASNCFSHQ